MNLSLNIPLLFAALLLVSTSALADDSTSAVDELKQGYALKQTGQCREAIPHFVRSIAIAATPKALLNLADCEAQTGDLLAAQRHAAQGRDLARDKNDVELVGVATAQLNALDARLPRLTVVIHVGAPRDSVITCDGVEVDASSISVPFALNPGEHAVVVSAKSYTSRTYRVALAEGARSRVEVEPEAIHNDPPSTSATAREAGPTDRTVSATDQGARKPVAIALAGIGVLGLAVGSVFGVLSKSAHSDADTHCQLGPQANLCDSQGVTSGDAAISRGNVSTWMFVGGATVLTAGAVFWFTTPRDGASGIAVSVGPVGASGPELRVAGAW
jgi:hypothetical protein